MGQPTGRTGVEPLQETQHANAFTVGASPSKPGWHLRNGKKVSPRKGVRQSSDARTATQPTWPYIGSVSSRAATSGSGATGAGAATGAFGLTAPQPVWPPAGAATSAFASGAHQPAAGQPAPLSTTDRPQPCQPAAPAPPVPQHASGSPPSPVSAANGNGGSDFAFHQAPSASEPDGAHTPRPMPRATRRTRGAQQGAMEWTPVLNGAASPAFFIHRQAAGGPAAPSSSPSPIALAAAAARQQAATRLVFEHDAQAGGATSSAAPAPPPHAVPAPSATLPAEAASSAPPGPAHEAGTSTHQPSTAEPPPVTFAGSGFSFRLAGLSGGAPTPSSMRHKQRARAAAHSTPAPAGAPPAAGATFGPATPAPAFSPMAWSPMNGVPPATNGSWASDTSTFHPSPQGSAHALGETTQPAVGPNDRTADQAGTCANGSVPFRWPSKAASPASQPVRPASAEPQHSEAATSQATAGGGTTSAAVNSSTQQALEEQAQRIAGLRLGVPPTAGPAPSSLPQQPSAPGTAGVSSAGPGGAAHVGRQDGAGQPGGSATGATDPRGRGSGPLGADTAGPPPGTAPGAAGSEAGKASTSFASAIPDTTANFSFTSTSASNPAASSHAANAPCAAANPAPRFAVSFNPSVTAISAAPNTFATGAAGAPASNGIAEPEAAETLGGAAPCEPAFKLGSISFDASTPARRQATRSRARRTPVRSGVDLGAPRQATRADLPAAAAPQAAVPQSLHPAPPPALSTAGNGSGGTERPPQPVAQPPPPPPSLQEEQMGRSRAQSASAKTAGNTHYGNKEYAQAEHWYSQALAALQPCAALQGVPTELAVLYSNRAGARIMVGKPRAALDDCQQSIRLDPKFFKAISRAATALCRMGDFDGARRALDGALDRLSAASSHFAELYKKLNEVKQTSASVSRLSSLLRGKGAGRAQLDKEALEQVVTELRALYPQVPYGEVLYQLRGVTHLALGQLKEASEACEPYHEAVSELAHSPWRLWIKAQAKYHAADLAGAITLLEQLAKAVATPAGVAASAATAGEGAIITVPDVAGAASALSHVSNLLRLKDLGNASIKALQYDKAVEHYSSALAAGCGCATAAVLFCNRAAAQQALGNLTDALADCARARALDPSYSRAHTRLATLLLEVRYPAAAASAISDFLKTSAASSLASSERSALSSRASEAKQTATWQKTADHYKMLAVVKAATDEDVRRSYRKMALKFHPDKALAGCKVAAALPAGPATALATTAEAEARVRTECTWLFNLISTAHEELSDKTRRCKVDQLLGSECARPTTSYTARSGYGGASTRNPYTAQGYDYGNRSYTSGQQHKASNGDPSQRYGRGQQQQQNQQQGYGYQGGQWWGTRNDAEEGSDDDEYAARYDAWGR